jgi:hypothetical protein
MSIFLEIWHPWWSQRGTFRSSSLLLTMKSSLCRTARHATPVTLVRFGIVTTPGARCSEKEASESGDRQARQAGFKASRPAGPIAEFTSGKCKFLGDNISVLGRGVKGRLHCGWNEKAGPPNESADAPPA